MIVSMHKQMETRYLNSYVSVDIMKDPTYKIVSTGNINYAYTIIGYDIETYPYHQPSIHKIHQ